MTNEQRRAAIQLALSEVRHRSFTADCRCNGFDFAAAAPVVAEMRRYLAEVEQLIADGMHQPLCELFT